MRMSVLLGMAEACSAHGQHPGRARALGCAHALPASGSDQRPGTAASVQLHSPLRRARSSTPSCRRQASTWRAMSTQPCDSCQACAHRTAIDAPALVPDAVAINSELERLVFEVAQAAAAVLQQLSDSRRVGTGLAVLLVNLVALSLIPPGAVVCGVVVIAGDDDLAWVRQRAGGASVSVKPRCAAPALTAATRSAAQTPRCRRCRLDRRNGAARPAPASSARAPRSGVSWHALHRARRSAQCCVCPRSPRNGHDARSGVRVDFVRRMCGERRLSHVAAPERQPPLGKRALAATYHRSTMRRLGEQCLTYFAAQGITSSTEACEDCRARAGKGGGAPQGSEGGASVRKRLTSAPTLFVAGTRDARARLSRVPRRRGTSWCCSLTARRALRPCSACAELHLRSTTILNHSPPIAESCTSEERLRIALTMAPPARPSSAAPARRPAMSASTSRSTMASSDGAGPSASRVPASRSNGPPLSGRAGASSSQSEDGHAVGRPRAGSVAVASTATGRRRDEDETNIQVVVRVR
jgi:hypothetical protein